MKADLAVKVSEIMTMLDANSDGKIDFDEFCKGAKQLATLKD